MASMEESETGVHVDNHAIQANIYSLWRGRPCGYSRHVAPLSFQLKNKIVVPS